MTVPIPPPNTRRPPPPDPRASSTLSLSLLPCQSIYLLSSHAIHSRLVTSALDACSRFTGRWVLIVSQVCSFVKPSLTGITLEEVADFLEKRGALSYRAKQI